MNQISTEVTSAAALILSLTSLLAMFLVAKATFEYGIGGKPLPYFIAAIFIVGLGSISFGIMDGLKNIPIAQTVEPSNQGSNPPSIFGVICLSLSIYLYYRQKRNQQPANDSKTQHNKLER
jgi:hypothetical protein